MKPSYLFITFMKTLLLVLVNYVISAPKRLWNWFVSLRAECRCYTIGVIIIGVAIALGLFSYPQAENTAYTGAFVFILGLIPLIEATYERVWRKLLGKLLIAALVALSSNMAYGVGRQLVASLVNTNPAQFSSTVNIATILVSPLLFIAAFAIVGIFIFIAAFFCSSVALMALISFKASRKRGLITLWFCRFVAFGTVSFGSLTLLTHSTGYADWVGRSATEYLFTFDMYHDPFYAKEKTEKVALLADGRMLVGSRPTDGTNIIFTIRQSLPNESKDGKTGSALE